MLPWRACNRHPSLSCSSTAFIVDTSSGKWIRYDGLSHSLPCDRLNQPTQAIIKRVKASPHTTAWQWRPFESLCHLYNEGGLPLASSPKSAMTHQARILATLSVQLTFINETRLPKDSPQSTSCSSKDRNLLNEVYHHGKRWNCVCNELMPLQRDWNNVKLSGASRSTLYTSTQKDLNQKCHRWFARKWIRLNSITDNVDLFNRTCDRRRHNNLSPETPLEHGPSYWKNEKREQNYFTEQLLWQQRSVFQLSSRKRPSYIWKISL